MNDISKIMSFTREFNLIKKYGGKLKNNKNSEEIGSVCNLRNKSKFIKDSEAHIRNNLSKSFALIHYDINKFTIINNCVGYKVGDEILNRISKVLKNSLKNEIIGKAEGDNFFVLQEYNSQDEIVDKSLEISKGIEKLCIWDEIKINPAVKTGIFFINNDELDIRMAIDRSRFAKIILKNNYRSEQVIYNEKIGNELIEAKKIADDMRKALAEKEFKVYFQPKIDLKTGEITGAEALVRWEHPQLGLIGPDRFIPIFERNGFIIKLDKYVFEEVCINIRSWIESGYEIVPVSVNVSRIDFLCSSFVSDYSEIKKKHKITDQLIEIEITESIAFGSENLEEVFSIMNEFRDAGFEISIDDFGSGYSSLGLLKKMPANTLKLDKMFLDNIEDYNSQVIVSNIVNMAKKLKLNVVSEGVETDIQVKLLRDMGCDMAQGFIFAKPQPIVSFVNLIKNGKVNYY